MGYRVNDRNPEKPDNLDYGRGNLSYLQAVLSLRLRSGRSKMKETDFPKAAMKLHEERTEEGERGSTTILYLKLRIMVT